MDPADFTELLGNDAEEYDAAGDDVVELASEEPRGLVGKLFDAGRGVVTSVVGTVKSWVVGEQVTHGPKTLAEYAEEQYQAMITRVKLHFRTAILSPSHTSYPIFTLSTTAPPTAISLYDILPPSIQPDDPIAVRMKTLEESSTLLWLLDRVLPVTRWAVQMITAVPRRLAQVLVVEMSLMKEAASRVAIKAILEYRRGKEEAPAAGEPAEEEKLVPRDITCLINAGDVSDEWTAELTATFAGPKNLFRRLYMGGYWIDTPIARRGLATAKIMNDLQFGCGTYLYNSETLETVEDLMALLKKLGFKASTYMNVRIADFLDLHEIDGMPPAPEDDQPAPKPDLATLTITDAVTPVLVLIPSSSSSSSASPYIFPCMHSEWHLLFTHPTSVSLGFRFFHDMSSGAQFHPRDAWGLPVWIENRCFYEEEGRGWEVTGEVLRASRVYVEGVQKAELGKNGGYGLIGVCQDSAAYVEHSVFHTITPPQIAGDLQARSILARLRPEMSGILALPDDGLPSKDHLERLAKTFPRNCGGLKVLEETRDRLVKEGYEVPRDLVV